MTQTFNKVRYIELLKKDRSLKSQNSSLYYEDPMEYRECLSYGVMLENQIFYNRRQEYIALMERYLKNEINRSEMLYNYFGLDRKDKKILEDLDKNFQQLANVSIDSKSAEVGRLISEISDVWELADCGDEEVDELKWRAFIEKTLSEIQQFNDTKKVPMDDSLEILRQVTEPYGTGMKLILISLMATGIALFRIDFIQ